MKLMDIHQRKYSSILKDKIIIMKIYPLEGHHFIKES